MTESGASKSNRDHVIMVRMRPDEYKRIERGAMSRGLPMSTFLRMLALDSLRKLR